jgi:hypothetical protein
MSETFDTLRQKLLAAGSLAAMIMSFVTFALGTSLSVPLRRVGVVASVAGFVAIAAYYMVKSIRALAVKAEALAEEVDMAWGQVKSLNVEKQEWQKEGNPHGRAVRAGAALRGIVYYNYQADCRLEESGGFEIATDLSMAATMQGVTSIEHEVVAPHAPADWDKAIELTAEDKDDANVVLKPVMTSKTATHLHWYLRAIPEFTQGHTIKYCYREHLPPGSFAMSIEELSKRDMQWEFFYIAITWPTEKLQLTVTFPSDYVIDELSYDVWFTPKGKVRNTNEYSRVGTKSFWLAKSKRNSEGLQGRLCVPFPVQGLCYVVKWKPPPGAPVEAASAP